MTASANPSPSRYVNTGKQMLAFQALPDQDDEDNESQLDVTLASILSSDLLRGKKAVTIQHNGSVYRLQATRLGKLILTK